MPDRKLPIGVGPALTVAVALLLAAAPPAGGAATAGAIPHLEWTSAELWGADVRSLVIDPRQPDTVLAGTSAGHVYLSKDGGASWAPAGAPVALPGWVVGTLVFDPNRPSRLWAGLWGIWGGGVVVYSEDLGGTWRHPHPVHEEEQIYALALVPGRDGPPLRRDPHRGLPVDRRRRELAPRDPRPSRDPERLEPLRRRAGSAHGDRRHLAPRLPQR